VAQKGPDPNIIWSVAMSETDSHSDIIIKFSDKFSDAVNKPHKMKACWQLAGDSFEPAIPGCIAKIKYNHLLTKYRELLAENKRTVVQAPTWWY